MNIQFTITANTFRKAADIEDFLKEKGISYASRADDKPSLGSPRTRRAAPTRISKEQLAAVLQEIARHPDWSWVDVGKSCGVNDQAVGKIARGTHILQGKKANSDRLQDAVDVL